MANGMKPLRMLGRKSFERWGHTHQHTNKENSQPTRRQRHQVVRIATKLFSIPFSEFSFFLSELILSLVDMMWSAQWKYVSKTWADVK